MFNRDRVPIKLCLKGVAEHTNRGRSQEKKFEELWTNDGEYEWIIANVWAELSNNGMVDMSFQRKISGCIEKLNA